MNNEIENIKSRLRNDTMKESFDNSELQSYRRSDDIHQGTNLFLTNDQLGMIYFHFFNLYKKFTELKFRIKEYCR